LVDFSIGIAGMKALRDDRGRRDPHGYTLQASLEAVADELACAAGLACGKLNRTPACIVRGFRYESGPGRARDLLRPTATDLFR
jgi:coenzyme F420-0:L-glutamate ligase/coenzyme F420-1:gamma-L-glutamate ligase